MASVPAGVGQGREFVDNVDMWTIDFKSVNPLWGRAGCRRGPLSLLYIHTVYLSPHKPIN